MKITELIGKWSFSETESKEKYPVTTPGSVLSGLLENKLIEDPFFRDNEYATREILRKNYEFARTFNIDEKPEVSELVMEGIDTIATVYINGVKLTSTENMHRTYIVNVNDYLTIGSNEIKIVFTSPLEYVENVVPTPGKEITIIPAGGIKGNQYIRKAHSMFGWDWGPQLPDMGIWRNIYIRQYEEAVLERFYVIQKTDVKKKTSQIKVEPTIRLADGKEISLKESGLKALLTVCGPDGEVICEDVDATKTVKIKDAKLWWCNGLGEQPLYTVSVSLFDDSNNALKGNTVTEKIGLRTLTVSTKKDAWGKEFALCINDRNVFAKGADYIPEDCVYNRIGKQQIDYLLESSKTAGFNTIRVWGGGYYPSKEFYELCDEKGLMVWQDFMYACNIYDLTDEFKNNIIAETEDNIRRLRNHASLALWCGNNEMESAWLNWGGWQDHSKELRKDYLTMFESLIPSILKKEDPNHFYWPSSPSSGGKFNDPDSDNEGDRHYWDVWHGEKPFTDYENHYFRFCSEFGFQSFPELATVKTFAADGDMNIFSKVMESHQKNDAANAKILKYLSDNFLYPDNFEHLLYVSQILQGMAIKYGVEHWRRNRGRCMGAIYWQLNDNWPVASWASIDYFGRWKALHYMAKSFFKNIAGSLKREGNVFVPFVQNETFELDDSTCTFYVKNVQNEILFKHEDEIRTAAFGVGCAAGIDVESIVKGREEEIYIEAVFTHSDGTVTKLVEPVTLYKHMQLPKANIEIKNICIEKDNIEITLSANTFAAFTALTCYEANIIWDDNFFFLTDSDDVTVKGKIIGKIPEKLNVFAMSLCDSYEN